MPTPGDYLNLRLVLGSRLIASQPTEPLRFYDYLNGSTVKAHLHFPNTGPRREIWLVQYTIVDPVDRDDFFQTNPLALGQSPDEPLSIDGILYGDDMPALVMFVNQEGLRMYRVCPHADNHLHRDRSLCRTASENDCYVVG